ncbi:MAG: AarF/ABC1/UbiB kinase family protein [Candidatus Riflebacteria bacterium]|nr:AarF/ABC1/UbiB kinase family protein [Candidatus Riflebacteria bacterium]
MEDLGPTFIKLGQVLSTRRDVFPEEYIEEFARLQDSVPPMDYERVRDVFAKELGRDPGEVFQEFDPTPLAAASIGQVHKAVLKGGEKVVVKVQRDGIRSTIRSDIDLLHILAKWAESSGMLDPIYGATEIVEEFGRSIHQELDYLREAQNVVAFRKNFDGDRTVHIPRIYEEYTTTRLLCMEFIQGKKASRFQETDCDPREIARRGALAVLKQLFQDGCFHADPHPGNILIMPGNVVCFMDFGMTGRLSVKMRDHLAWFLILLLNRDYDALSRALVEIGDPLEDVDLDALSTSLLDTLDPYQGASLRMIDLGNLIRSVSRLLVRYRLRLPTGYTLMIKSLVTVEGLGRKLDPSFDITALARPFVERLIADRWKPKRLAHDLELMTLDLSSFARRTPQQLSRILNKIQHGLLDLQFNHKGLDPLTHSLDKASKRLAHAMIISALVVSSSLIMASMSAVGVNYWIGIAGYLIAGGLSVLLIFL